MTAEEELFDPERLRGRWRPEGEDGSTLVHPRLREVAPAPDPQAELAQILEQLEGLLAERHPDGAEAFAALLAPARRSGAAPAEVEAALIALEELLEVYVQQELIRRVVR